MVSSELGKMASYFVLFTNLIHYYSHKEIQFCQNLLCSTKTDCDPEILESYKDSEMDCSHFSLWLGSERAHSFPASSPFSFYGSHLKESMCLAKSHLVIHDTVPVLFGLTYIDWLGILVHLIAITGFFYRMGIVDN